MGPWVKLLACYYYWPTIHTVTCTEDQLCSWHDPDQWPQFCYLHISRVQTLFIVAAAVISECEISGGKKKKKGFAKLRSPNLHYIKKYIKIYNKIMSPTCFCVGTKLHEDVT